MIHRSSSAGYGGLTFGLLAGVALAAILVLGAWLLVAGGIGRPSVRVNDHTDDGVPTVNLRPSPRPVNA